MAYPQAFFMRNVAKAVTNRADIQAGDLLPHHPELKPAKVELVQGMTYYWCSCGFSKTQPFCDGSHMKAKTPYKPLMFTWEEETAEKRLCQCKVNKIEKGPFCDGSHNALRKAQEEQAEKREQ